LTEVQLELKLEKLIKNGFLFIWVEKEFLMDVSNQREKQWL
jgi:hypothetical protein